MRLALVLFILPFILGLGLTLRITDFINQFINENSNQRQLEEFPGATDQILPVFATALVTSIINSVLFSAEKEEEFHWCYSDSSCDEDAWKDHYPNCNGFRQSPIDVDFASTTASGTHSNGALTFGGYDQVRVGVFSNTVEHNNRRTSGVKSVTDNDLTNNGHTAQLDVNMPGAGEGVLSGGPLSEDYQILQLHFHWGKTNDKGSEHTYDGMAFPLEMHIVHVKSSLKNEVDLKTALSTIDGLAVTGFVFMIGSENAALKPITDAMSQITTSGGEIPFTGTSFQLNNLIDPVITATNARYSTYDGGLTTPGCMEVVKWINFETPLEISTGQLDQFRTLMDGKGKMIYDNFRSTQPLNGRIVEHYTVA